MRLTLQRAYDVSYYCKASFLRDSHSSLVYKLNRPPFCNGWKCVCDFQFHNVLDQKVAETDFEFGVQK